jgi:hypothetical protein
MFAANLETEYYGGVNWLLSINKFVWVKKQFLHKTQLFNN